MLKLRCELCDNDQVQVEHSLAQLPGALILHIKRFSSLVSSPEAATAKDAATPKRPSPGALETNSSNANSSSTAAGVPSTAGSKAELPLQEVHSWSEGSGGRVSDGQSGCSGSGTRGEISYVKLMAPVSIPKELDLERFCSSYTANAPVGELGEVRWACFLALVCRFVSFTVPVSPLRNRRSPLFLLLRDESRAYLRGRKDGN